MSTALIDILAISTPIAIVLIAAALTDSHYLIKRNIIIDKPVNEVFSYIKFIRNQDYYNKWVMMDLNARKTFTGTDGTVGFVMTWDSDNKKVGTGEQEIKKIIEGERLQSEIRFKKPFESTSQAYITTEPVTGNQTKVTWAFEGDRNFIMKLFYILFNIKNGLTKDFDINLANLKSVLEKNSPA